MKQIFAESLRWCADQYSEEDEKANAPTENGYASEMSGIGTLTYNLLAVTIAVERVDPEKTVEAATHCILKDAIVNVLSNHTNMKPIYT